MPLQHGLELGQGALGFTFAHLHPLIDRPRHDGLGVGATLRPAARIAGLALFEPRMARWPSIADLVAVSGATGFFFDALLCHHAASRWPAAGDAGSAMRVR